MDQIREAVFNTGDPPALATYPLTRVLGKVALTSFAVCSIQLGFFCMFRRLCRGVYQPRSYYSNLPPDPSPFTWIRNVWVHSCDYYLATMGLDAYFFMRYLNVLGAFFIGVGLLNAIVLIPITASSAAGKLVEVVSITNIPTLLWPRCHAHCVMAVVSVTLFHLMVKTELAKYHEIKYDYLKNNMGPGARTVLFSNVPLEWLSLQSLVSVLKPVGAIEAVYFVPHAPTLSHHAGWVEYAFEELESSLIQYTRNYLSRRCRVKSKRWKVWRYWKPRFDTLNVTHRYERGCEPRMYPPIVLGGHMWKTQWYWVTLPGWCRVLVWMKLVVAQLWCVDTALYQIHAIESLTRQRQQGQLPLHPQVFIRFRTVATAAIAHQCHIPGLEANAINITPLNIIWSNVCQLQLRLLVLARRHTVDVVCFLVILLYVFPTSLIGLIFSVPFLTTVLPFTGWLFLMFPARVHDIMEGLVPSFCLRWLSQAMNWGFRRGAECQGWMVFSQIELHLQWWYFLFLWLHQFLVMTVLSSVFRLGQQIVEDPQCILPLLASNVPRASIFYFHFFVTQAFANLGGGLFRFGLVIRHALDRLHLRYAKLTPRQRFKRLLSLPQVLWGTTYPQYTVYACISLCYMVISPVVSLLLVILVGFAQVYYRYALKYIYDPNNPAEAYGQFYPLALMQLYWGVYSMELTLMAYFFCHPSNALAFDGWLMVILMMVTAYFHRVQQAKVNRSSTLISLRSKKPHHDKSSPEAFEHPDWKTKTPPLWLPRDPLDICQFQFRKVSPGSSRGAYLQHTHYRMPVKIISGPPDQP